METYIALLRGINVGGQKKIKMAELRIHLAELPFSNIATYIQSGNIIFSSDLQSHEQLAGMIREKIKEKYEFDVPTIVKKPQEFKDVLTNNPFQEDEEKETKRIYFTFLDASPAEDRIEVLKEVDYSPEEYVILERCIYFFSPQGYGRAKMNNNFFEKKLKVGATTRNWRTVNKLLEMSQG